MANATETALSQVEENVPSRNAIVFSGESRSMAIGFAMLAAGIAAFVADLTDTFFAEATAWVFIIWGLLFLYGDLLLMTRKFIVTEEGLEIYIPFRFWSRRKLWAWKNIYRMDLVIDRRNTHPRDCKIQIYHQYPGEISIDREDRDFDPELVALIIDRAQLKPNGDAAGISLDNLPFGRSAVYTWKK